MLSIPGGWVWLNETIIYGSTGKQTATPGGGAGATNMIPPTATPKLNNAVRQDAAVSSWAIAGAGLTASVTALL